MDFAGVSVLITGATGFIGSHLAERLLSLDARVRILARNPAKAARFAARGADVVSGDLTAPEALRKACAGCQVVCHSAAWLGTPYTEEAAWAANVTGTATLASEALAAKVRRFVHLSSMAVYGPVRWGVVTEDSALWRGVELYGDSKIAGEDAIRTAVRQGLPAVILRPGIVYGPHSTGWTLRFVDWIAKGLPVMIAGGHGLARPIFIDNLVDAILLAIDRPVTGHAFTLVDRDMPWREFLGYYGRMLRKPTRSVPLAIAYLLAALDETRAFLTRKPPRLRPAAVGYAISHAHYDTDKAKRLLGWIPQLSPDRAMQVTEQWLKEQGVIPS